LAEAAELIELGQHADIDPLWMLAEDLQPARGDLAHASSRPFQQTSLDQICRRPGGPVVELALPTAGQQLDQLFRRQAELAGQQRPYRRPIQFCTIRMQLEQRSHQRLVVGQSHLSPPEAVERGHARPAHTIHSVSCMRRAVAAISSERGAGLR
jgi:hypothetical protein